IVGFKKLEDTKWATLMFVFSLNHLTIIFALMIILSFFK
ncbi:protoheme IX farnesyltransferase, partial [Priestia megaterium]